MLPDNYKEVALKVKDVIEESGIAEFAVDTAMKDGDDPATVLANIGAAVSMLILKKRVKFVDTLESIQENLLIRVVTYCTVDAILEAIRRNGLEKTLQDLRGVYTPSKTIAPSDETTYQGMLLRVEDHSRQIKQKESHGE